MSVGVHNVATATNTDVLDLKTAINFAGLLPVENIYETGEKPFPRKITFCIMSLEFLMW